MRRFEEAIEALQQAVEIFREFGDRHGEGGALSNLGAALEEVRRFEEAIEAHQQAVEIFREFGDRHGEGQALNNLGLALSEDGQTCQARIAWAEAAAAYEGGGSIEQAQALRTWLAEHPGED